MDKRLIDRVQSLTGFSIYFRYVSSCARLRFALGDTQMSFRCDPVSENSWDKTKTRELDKGMRYHRCHNRVRIEHKVSLFFEVKQSVKSLIMQTIFLVFWHLDS